MPEYDPRVRRRIYWAQTMAYVLIMSVIIAGFATFSQQQHRNCQNAYDNRLAIRAMSVAIAELGRNLVLGNKPEGHITEDQRLAMDEFDRFKTQQIEHLPLPDCN